MIHFAPIVWGRSKPSGFLNEIVIQDGDEIGAFVLRGEGWALGGARIVVMAVRG